MRLTLRIDHPSIFQAHLCLLAFITSKILYPAIAKSHVVRKFSIDTLRYEIRNSCKNARKFIVN